MASVNVWFVALRSALSATPLSCIAPWPLVVRRPRICAVCCGSSPLVLVCLQRSRVRRPLSTDAPERDCGAHPRIGELRCGAGVAIGQRPASARGSTATACVERGCYLAAPTMQAATRLLSPTTRRGQQQTRHRLQTEARPAHGAQRRTDSRSPRERGGRSEGQRSACAAIDRVPRARKLLYHRQRHDIAIGTQETSGHES